MNTNDQTYSSPFFSMATRIDHNKPEEFGGAFVIVPPSGDPISVMSLDGAQDVGVFWATLAARIAVIQKQNMAQMDSQSRNPWGGNR